MTLIIQNIYHIVQNIATRVPVVSKYTPVVHVESSLGSIKPEPILIGSRAFYMNAASGGMKATFKMNESNGMNSTSQEAEVYDGPIKAQLIFVMCTF